MRSFLAGLAIGYGVGTLFTPRSGVEVRADISHRVRRAFTALGWQANTQETAIAYALNHASAEELMRVRGIGKGLARRIIRHRPYKSGNEILNEKVLPSPTFERLKDELTKEAG